MSERATHDHALAGCRPEPLSSYLKALGVLRLVAEQVDPDARGWWEDATFRLRTRLTRDDLDRFFLEDYTPTPIVAPWNGGSGFAAGDATAGIDAITASTGERFASFREVIAAIRAWPEMPPSFETIEDVLAPLAAAAAQGEGQAARKQEALVDAIEGALAAAAEGGATLSRSLRLDEIEGRTKKGDAATKARFRPLWAAVKKGRTASNQLARSAGKEQLLAVCRARLPDDVVEWLDAACALGTDGAAGYNPLLGSGGNEGRLEFSNNYMQRLAELLLNGDAGHTCALLRAALRTTPMAGMSKAAVGQHEPGSTGGANQGFGVAGHPVSNPWDFVLQFEGALLLASALARRARSDVGRLSSPFTVRSSPVGYSSSDCDEQARAETWLPLWSRPAGLRTLRHLFGEGRCQVGRRVAANGLDFARAVSTLGVDRGIDAFVRYVYLERRGQGYYVALPAGRIAVRHRPKARLLDELDPLLGPLDRFLRRFPTVPASFARARRQVDEALYACALRPDAPHFEALVRALGRIEREVAQRARGRDPELNRPLGGLGAAWIDACDDGSVEVRIAAALAAVHGTGDVGPLRANLAGVDAHRPWLWAASGSQRAWRGSDLAERLGGALVRRVMDAGRLRAPTSPVQGWLPLRADDVTPFLLGLTDDRRVEELLWGFTLVDGRGPKDHPLSERWRQPAARLPLSRAWALLRLVHVPQKVRGVALPLEPRVASLLLARRTDEALAVAARRLRVSGLEPLAVPDDPPEAPGRLLASLLVPIRDPERLARAVLQQPASDESAV